MMYIYTPIFLVILYKTWQLKLPKAYASVSYIGDRLTVGLATKRSTDRENLLMESDSKRNLFLSE